MSDRIQPAPDAVLGRSDDTRRWAIVDAAGERRFPGVTRPEARRALGGLPRASWGAYLVAVALPVLLTDGAGPHLLDAEGNLVLALADHPHLPGCKLALGPLRGAEQAGVVEPAGAEALWRWATRAVIDPAHRAAALGALEAVIDRAQLEGWVRRAATWG
jgi:hypothetical protein